MDGDGREKQCGFGEVGKIRGRQEDSAAKLKNLISYFLQPTLQTVGKLNGCNLQDISLSLVCFNGLFSSGLRGAGGEGRRFQRCTAYLLSGSKRLCRERRADHFDKVLLSR